MLIRKGATIKKVLFVLGVVLLLVPLAAKAADYKLSQNGAVSIGKDEQVKNVYAGGNTVTSDAAVGGDLVAGGGTVNVNGSIAQSLIVGGGTITITGPVRQNSRVAGGNITINGNVGQDLNAAGGAINIASTSTTSGDLLAAGGAITLDGTINGNAKISGGQVTINGTIDGSADIYAQTVTIGDKAVIKGKLHYWSDKEITIPTSAQVGSVEFTRQEQNKSNYSFTGIPTTFKLFGLIATILLLLALRYLLPALTRRVDARIYTEPRTGILNHLGIGLLIMAATPIILIMLAISLVGLRIALVLGLAFALFLALASAFSPLLIGSGIMRLAKKFEEYDLNWLTIIVGAVAASLLGLIPVLGRLALFLFFLASLGAVAASIYDRLTGEK